MDRCEAICTQGSFFPFGASLVFGLAAKDFAGLGQMVWRAGMVIAKNNELGGGDGIE